jgi:hypothetical protein
MTLHDRPFVKKNGGLKNSLFHFFDILRVINSQKFSEI